MSGKFNKYCINRWANRWPLQQPTEGATTFVENRIYIVPRDKLQRRWWHPTPGLLPGKSHGRSLVGCSPWGHEESDATGRLPFHFSLSCIGEGNGNPLQCSCLENPRDRGAWWAAVCRVAQSQTWLKWLGGSSSSSRDKLRGRVSGSYQVKRERKVLIGRLVWL